jgi:hypothetical protein
MKFLNKSTGVTVNDDRSAEKGLGYYEENEAVIFTPNADLDLTETKILICYFNSCR